MNRFGRRRKLLFCTCAAMTVSSVLVPTETLGGVADIYVGSSNGTLIRYDADLNYITESAVTGGTAIEGILAHSSQQSAPGVAWRMFTLAMWNAG